MSIGGRNQIGPYRLLKLVRAGHTCQIWEAIRDSNQQRVALKMLQQEHQRDRVQVAMLRHELVVGQTLEHPGIIQIYEFDIDRERPYLCMEYYKSCNLKQWMRSEREGGEDLLPTIIERSAEGLAHLHEQGWTHCDIKPDNFLVGEQGEMKLIDFAIARKIRRGWGRFLQGRTKIRGTRSYMSPEQIRGGSLDERTDIYSFGCMLFELIAGRPPYTGFNADDLLQKHLTGAVPSLSTVGMDVHEEFAAQVSRMMAKLPANRQESMSEVLRDFRSLSSIFKKNLSRK